MVVIRDENSTNEGGWFLIAVLVLLVCGPATAFAGSTEAPTTDGGDWKSPEERTDGDIALYGGVGSFYVEELTPSMLLANGGANLHLGRYGAFTARTGLMVDSGDVVTPTMVGIRGQIPIGRSTVGFGPEAGMYWAFDSAGSPAPMPALALKTSYEYMLETGLFFAAEASVEVSLFGMVPRGALNVGYEF